MVTKKARLVKARERLETAESSASFPVSYSRRISAGDFKARCLALMDDVHDRGGEYLITKRGVPVARLVPVRHEPRRLFGSMKGTVTVLGDIVSPLEEPWEVLGGDDDERPT